MCCAVAHNTVFPVYREATPKQLAVAVTQPVIVVMNVWSSTHTRVCSTVFIYVEVRAFIRFYGYLEGYLRHIYCHFKNVELMNICGPAT